TWHAIAGNLPDAPINVVVEDARRTDLLFVGNDTGIFVSIDGGARWVKMNNNIPNVGVRDALVHPRDNDLILGPYGRGIWITNIAPLQQLDRAVLSDEAHLFEIGDTVQRVTWQFAANDYLFGQRHLQTPNDPQGMVIRYYLKRPAAKTPSILITDAAGQQVATLQGGHNAGINAVIWYMRQGGGRGGPGGGTGGSTALAAGAGGPAGRGRGNAVEQLAPLGEYTITLDVGTARMTQRARVTKTQGWSLAPSPQVIR